MKSVHELVETITSNPDIICSVFGQKKKIIGMAKYRTMNFPDFVYIKVVFNDHSYLLILPSDQELYYSDKYIYICEEVKDDEIGVKPMLSLNGTTYKLENADDYQYVIQFYKGTLDEIEGEVRFSDYFPTRGPKEFLSLGCIVRTGKRADLNPKLISIKDIEVVIQ